MTREEHLQWAKDRALEYADRGDVANALSSITSDLSKHPETAGHSGLELMGMLAVTGNLNSPHELRRYIEGFTSSRLRIQREHGSQGQPVAGIGWSPNKGITLSIKSKVFALAAAAGLAITGAAAFAATAHAATPSCGHDCADVFSREFGTHRTPGFVLDVLRQGSNVGQPVILWRTSNSDPAEDFTADFSGTTTADLFAAGLVGSAVALHYGCIAGQDFPNCGLTGVDDPATEIEYSPYGVGSGLCIGLAATATQGEGVTLQPCGVTARTVWILDINDSPATVTRGYIPLINGSDTNFSHPYVLDYPHNSFPTDSPRAQVFVNRLTGFSNGRGTPVGSVIDSQLWGADFGVLR